MADLVEFKPKSKLDNESAIELLESALEQARDGAITAVVLGYVRPDGTIGTSFSDGPAGPMMGVAGLLLHRVTMDD